MIEKQLCEARTASYTLLKLSAEQVNDVLLRLADALVANTERIVSANAIDLEEAIS